jgi:hypothetical protein
VPKEHAGAAGGAMSTLRYLGGVVGIAILGQLETTIDAHRQALLAFAVALGLALLVALALPGRAVEAPVVTAPHPR